MPRKKASESTAVSVSEASASDFSEAFLSYVNKIRKAKEEADNAVAKCPDDSLAAAKGALAITWEAVFDYCCKNDDGNTLSRLNSLAGIIHKLAASNLQLKNIESKFNVDGDCENDDDESLGLDEETISKIEEKLNLL